ncbi:MAG: hypothetical protein MJ053_01775 [Elusimicrobiaceae bacterium]|nr:hypothetical protein [Elusimicrobiaceae bacterium]
MSKCCKCAKWLPHNWLCLKGLTVVFLVLFYIAFVYGIYQAVLVVMHPAFTGRMMWVTLAFYLLSDWAAALGFLTIAKVLKALRKIKQAVAPCCCEGHTEEKTEEAK